MVLLGMLVINGQTVNPPKFVSQIIYVLLSLFIANFNLVYVWSDTTPWILQDMPTSPKKKKEISCWRILANATG